VQKKHFSTLFSFAIFYFWHFNHCPILDIIVNCLHTLKPSQSFLVDCCAWFHFLCCHQAIHKWSHMACFYFYFVLTRGPCYHGIIVTHIERPLFSWLQFYYFILRGRHCHGFNFIILFWEAVIVMASIIIFLCLPALAALTLLFC